MQEFNKYVVRANRNFLETLSGQQDQKAVKPKVLIISSFCELSGAGQPVLDIVEAVRLGINSAGGIGIHVPVAGISNVLAKAENYSNVIEPIKENTTNYIDTILTTAQFDACVFVPFGESGIKGMCLAAAKLNVPCLFIGVGPNRPVDYKGEKLTQSSVYTISAQKFLGQIDEATLKDFAENYLPNFGEGEGIYTSNALNCMIEVLGLSVKNAGTAECGSAERKKIATETGRAIVRMAKEQISPKKILTRANFQNAISLVLAIGADTNTISFIREFGAALNVEISLKQIEEISDKTPFLASIYPISENIFMHDFHAAGGVYGVLSRLLKIGKLNDKALDYDGESMSLEIKRTKVFEKHIILDGEKEMLLSDNPLLVMGGTIAEKGAFLRRTTLFKGLNGFSGYAMVFEGEETACHAIYAGRVKKGTVVVVRNLGQKGGPGKVAITYVQAAIRAAGLETDVAVITDGKSSSLFGGLVVSEIGPEAYEQQDLAFLADDDVIEINMDSARLNSKLNAKDLNTRRRQYSPHVRYEASATDKFYKKTTTTR
ncbi:MAG: dihydroxy-acid dehydratase [Firmicutes bacterium]|nr:dihydroxy-acid dehydratase [Bacillota bacterium]